MKQIGRTHDGKHLVEMTDTEVRVFGLLTKVAEGKIIYRAYPDDVHLDTNLTETFTVIRMWIEQADTVNQLQTAVSRMRDALGVQGECTCDVSKGKACGDCT